MKIPCVSTVELPLSEFSCEKELWHSQGVSFVKFVHMSAVNCE